MIVNLQRGYTAYIHKDEKLCFDSDTFKDFPLCFFGKNSYVVSSRVNTAFTDKVFSSSNSETFQYPFPRYVHNMQIGNYSSLAHNLDFILDLNHDYKSIYQGVLSNGISNNPVLKLNRKGQILIQNDVWVGMNVTIMGGVTIHNGAVIAANSVVVKDVAPYSIVGGNPATHIKYRFDKECIEKLQTIQWWYWNNPQIKSRLENFQGDAEEFADIYYQEALTIKSKIKNTILDIPLKERQFLFFLDSTDSFSINKSVILGFADYFRQDEESQLIIYATKEHLSFLDELNPMLADIQAKCSIYIHFGEDVDELSIFKYANYYISNRTNKTVYHSCYADMFNVKKISGVDIPLFYDELFK